MLIPTKVVVMKSIAVHRPYFWSLVMELLVHFLIVSFELFERIFEVEETVADENLQLFQGRIARIIKVVISTGDLVSRDLQALFLLCLTDQRDSTDLVSCTECAFRRNVSVFSA
jgi:hypothetical protein